MCRYITADVLSQVVDVLEIPRKHSGGDLPQVARIPQKIKRTHAHTGKMIFARLAPTLVCNGARYHDTPRNAKQMLDSFGMVDTIPWVMALSCPKNDWVHLLRAALGRVNNTRRMSAELIDELMQLSVVHWAFGCMRFMHEEFDATLPTMDRMLMHMPMRFPGNAEPTEFVEYVVAHSAPGAIRDPVTRTLDFASRFQPRHAAYFYRMCDKNDPDAHNRIHRCFDILTNATTHRVSEAIEVFRVYADVPVRDPFDVIRTCAMRRCDEQTRELVRYFVEERHITPTPQWYEHAAGCRYLSTLLYLLDLPFASTLDPHEHRSVFAAVVFTCCVPLYEKVLERYPTWNPGSRAVESLQHLSVTWASPDVIEWLTTHFADTRDTPVNLKRKRVE